MRCTVSSTAEPGKADIAGAQSVPVLTYHSLDTSGSVISVAPSDFRSQMIYLRSRGWRTLDLDQFLGGFTGRGWPRRSFLLTFDDAYHSFDTQAMPVLQLTGFTAVLFVVAGRVGQESDWVGQQSGIRRARLLDWAALKALADNGIEIGSHTLTHPHLSALSDSEMTREVICSKQVIEDRIGREVRAFAYPYGDRTPASERVVGGSFLAGFGTRLGIVGQNSRRSAFERVDAYYLRNGFLFAALGTDWLKGYLRFRHMARSIRAGVTRSSGLKWTKIY